MVEKLMCNKLINFLKFLCALGAHFVSNTKKKNKIKTNKHIIIISEWHLLNHVHVKHRFASFHGENMEKTIYVQRNFILFCYLPHRSRIFCLSFAIATSITHIT